MNIRIPSVGRRIYLLSFLALQRALSMGEVEKPAVNRWDDWDARAFVRRHFQDSSEIGVLRSTLAGDLYNVGDLSDEDIVDVAAHRLCNGDWYVGYESTSPPVSGRPGDSLSRSNYGPALMLDSLNGPSGKPGDLFDSPDSAAIGCLKYINKQSVCVDREHGGWIFKEHGNTGAEKYFFDEPTPGTQHQFPVPTPRNKRGVPVALYHTHGATSPMEPVTGNFYDDENFSRYVKDPKTGEFTGDTYTADHYKVPLYLGTPGGRIKKYTPKPGKSDRGKVEKIGTMPRIRERRDCQ